MAEIVLAVVGPAIELGKCIAEPMKRQINYLRCFNNNVQNLREEVKKLEDKREELQGRVRRDRDNNQVILRRATSWLDQADEELLQVNRSEIDSEIDNIKSGCLAVKSRYSLSKKVKKKTEALKELRDACPKSDEPISSPPPPVASVSNIPLGAMPYEFESRKKNEEDILMALKRSSVVGIWGMGGVGKTTMAKSVIRKVREERVIRKAQEEKLFDEIVELTVSQHVDKLKIQGVMAGRLGLELVGENSDLSSRAKQLQDRLKGRKILLFLDDVWERLDLEELIGLSRRSGLEGCKVLLTSRSGDVLDGMGAERFEIQTLSEDEAWSLFKDKTEIDDPDLPPQAREIVRECKGLPVALITVAAALKVRKNDIHSWRVALRQLKNRNPKNLPKILAEVYNPLKLSYDYLKSQDDQQQNQTIFLLCCLFPEDYNISLKYLALYAMGLRMFEDIRTLDEVSDEIWSSIETLRKHSLLLEGVDKDHVRMHDVVRDVAIFIATKEERIKCGDCTWASPYVGERIEFPVGSNLNLLMFDEIADKERQIDDSFFRGKRNLKVLSIENWEWRSLPHTIEFRMNLRTLILQSCWCLEIIRVVSEFVNLEVLICRYCWGLEELPTEMRRLKCLRLLEISDCESVKQIAAGVISSLDKLEELKIVRSFKKWEGEKKEGGGGGNARLSELESLSNLTCLEIEIEDYNLAAQHIRLSPKIVKYDIKIGGVTFHPRREKISAEKKLGVHLPQEIILGNWIHECVKSAEWISSEGDGSKSLDLGLAHQNLRWLNIERCRSTLSSVLWGSRGVTTNVFPLLEYLKLKDLDNLEEIGHIDGPPSNASSSSDNISFKNLRELQLLFLPALKHLWKRGPYQDKVVPLIFSNLSSILVGGCHSLPNLLSLSTTTDVCFSQLGSLCINGCDKMEQVFLWSEEEKEKNIGQGNRRTIRFPKLQSLTLQYLPRLKTLCQGIETIEFPLLTRVKISECPNLKGLVSASDGGIENDKVVFDKLEELKIQNSMLIWCDSTPIDFFNTLAILTIDICDGIKSLFSFSIACNLTHLKVLRIERCGEMVKVIGGEEDYSSNESTTDLFSELNSRVESVRFPKLECLKLRRLPRLTSFCNGSGNIEFPLLTCLEISECPNLKGLVSASDEGIENRKVVFGKLEELTIHNSMPIWCDSTPIDFFTTLAELKIESCDGIKSLFSFPIACNLISLKILTIEGCSEMVNVIEGEEEYSSNESIEGRALNLPSLSCVEIKGCPKLERFSLGSLTTPQLKTVSAGYADITFDKEQDLNGVLQQKVVFRKFEKLTIDTLMPVWRDPTPVDFFTAIVVLKIIGCDKIRCLFSFPVACNLNNLKELQICCCLEMVKVIEVEEEYSSNEPTTGLFPCLGELTLSFLFKLKIFSQLGHALNLPSLSRVEICRCPKLESFSLGSLTTPQLKTIRVNWKEIASDKEQGLNGGLRRCYLLRQEEEKSTSNVNVDLDMDKQNNGAVESKRNVIDQEEKEECETEQEDCEAEQERE